MISLLERGKRGMVYSYQFCSSYNDNTIRTIKSACPSGCEACIVCHTAAFHYVDSSKGPIKVVIQLGMNREAGTT